MPSSSPRLATEPSEKFDNRAPPRGTIALHLVERWRQAGSGGLVFLAQSERLAEHLGANIHSLVPDCPIVVFPRWDCLPYDFAGPSREVMGRRASVLRRLAGGIDAPLVISTPEAMLQRVPPRDIWQKAVLRLELGRNISLCCLRSFLQRTGYNVGTLVDEPGEAALHGQVVDVFPAGALGPVRIDHDDGHVTGLYSYDPVSQRTIGQLDHIELDAASEMLPQTAVDGTAVDEAAAQTAEPGWLCDWYPRLETLFDYLPQAAFLLDAGTDERIALWRDRISEEYSGLKRMPDAAAAVGSRSAPEPEKLYCNEREWRDRLAEQRAEILESASWESLRIPVFATEPNPTRAYRSFVAAQIAQGRRVVLTGAEDRDLKLLSRRAVPALETPPMRVGEWDAVLEAPATATLALQVDFEAGFLVPSAKTAVIAAADLLGSRAGHEVPMELARRVDAGAAEPLLRLGDAVVHLDHGIGLLRGIETLSTPGIPDQEVIRLEYAGGTALFVPVQEIGSIWRYGSATEAVSLDRLDSEAWRKRRDEIGAEIAQSARALADLTSERERQKAAILAPSAHLYERFAARFPFDATPDQARAIEDVLQDLRSGQPMDRLVCGDVGFGKTEIALRAAAAAVLSGKQVAVVAPTTVLARQHIETFNKRFAPFGIKIGQLSRLVKPAQSRVVKEGWPTAPFKSSLERMQLPAKASVSKRSD